MTILFIVGTSFVERTPVVEALDIVFGLTILADFTARPVVSRDRVRNLLQPATLADVIAILPFWPRWHAFLQTVCGQVLARSQH